jgi:hypothetical protein
MKRFVTEYQKTDGIYCGHVDALDFEHAQMICDERGFGEDVKGVLYAVIPASDRFGTEQADAMCKAFAESGDDEPPDAIEFDRLEIQ